MAWTRFFRRSRKDDDVAREIASYVAIETDDNRAVLGVVLREAVVLVAIGLIVGTALGLGLTRYARTLLFGLQPTDPVTVAAALTLLAVIGLGASYLPARRASRLDPVRVLRDE